MDDATMMRVRQELAEARERFERDAVTIAAGEGFENPLPAAIDELLVSESPEDVATGTSRAVAYFLRQADALRQAQDELQGGAS